MLSVPVEESKLALKPCEVPPRRVSSPATKPLPIVAVAPVSCPALPWFTETLPSSDVGRPFSVNVLEVDWTELMTGGNCGVETSTLRLTVLLCAVPSLTEKVISRVLVSGDVLEFPNVTWRSAC